MWYACRFAKTQASQANEWQEWGAKVAPWKHLEKLQERQSQLILMNSGWSSEATRLRTMMASETCLHCRFFSRNLWCQQRERHLYFFCILCVLKTPYFLWGKGKTVAHFSAFRHAKIFCFVWGDEFIRTVSDSCLNLCEDDRGFAWFYAECKKTLSFSLPPKMDWGAMFRFSHWTAAHHQGS